MRRHLAALAIILWVRSASSIIDPDPDQIGVYFDTDANTSCITVPMNNQFDVYVMITNPSAADVEGWEFGYRIVVPEGSESSVIRVGDSTACWFWPDPETWLSGDHVCGLAPLEPVTGSIVTLVNWQYLLIAPGITMDFYIGPSSMQSIEDGLPGYDAGGVFRPLGISSGDVNLPVASVNGDCRAISVDKLTFGQLKSLYR
jgi:hypothetical protein